MKFVVETMRTDKNIHIENKESHRILSLHHAGTKRRTCLSSYSQLVSQTLRPLLWVIVDGGSTDRTPEIITEAAFAHECSA